MNVVMLSGRLVRDIKPNESGKLANATLAVDRPYPFSKNRNGDRVSDFLMIKFIGEKNANSATQYLHKGVKINLRGIVCRDSWQESDGTWNEQNYIIVQDWEFCESKAASEQNANRSSSDDFSQPSAQRQQATPSNDDFMDVSGDDDLVPFA